MQINFQRMTSSMHKQKNDSRYSTSEIAPTESGTSSTIQIDSNDRGYYYESEYAQYEDVSPFDQELFVFEFGSAVFWGFDLGQETNLLKTIKMFSYKNIFSHREFLKSEDDMGYYISRDASSVRYSFRDDLLN